eukprot:gene7788-7986_t
MTFAAAEISGSDAASAIDWPLSGRIADSQRTEIAAHTSSKQSRKTIYLIRHGEGWHNVGYANNLDPHLTPRGWAQTAALQQHLSSLQDKLDIELVVVSPLRRTLETSAGANMRYLPLARAVGSAGCRPLQLLAHEGCRERMGPNVCDKFRDMDLQVVDFPGVDFSMIEHQHDVEWDRVSQATCKNGCYFVGEQESAAEARALVFYRWLMSRPEQTIAIVSHCGFLVHSMRALGEVVGRMSLDWENCEMRSIVLQWGPAHFAGSTAGNMEVDDTRWLWADPGDSNVWFPEGVETAVAQSESPQLQPAAPCIAAAQEQSTSQQAALAATDDLHEQRSESAVAVVRKAAETQAPAPAVSKAAGNAGNSKKKKAISTSAGTSKTSSQSAANSKATVSSKSSKQGGSINATAAAASTALAAAKLGLTDQLSTALSAAPAAAGLRDVDGRCCLHYAAGYGHEDCVDLLLSKGGQEAVRIRDANGDMPLHLAAQQGQPMCAYNIAKVCPACCLVKNKRGQSPIDVAAAAARGEVLNALLLACAGDGKSAVAVAAMRLLLAAGAVPDTWAPNGSSALMLAAAADGVTALQVLLEGGATIELQDALGRSALMFAAGNGAAAACQVLLDAKASLSSRDRRGRAALDYAPAASSSLPPGTDAGIGSQTTCTPVAQTAAAADSSADISQVVGRVGLAAAGHEQDDDAGLYEVKGSCMEEDGTSSRQRDDWQLAVELCAADGKHIPELKLDLRSEYCGGGSSFVAPVKQPATGSSSGSSSSHERRCSDAAGGSAGRSMLTGLLAAAADGEWTGPDRAGCLAATAMSNNSSHALPAEITPGARGGVESQLNALGVSTATRRSFESARAAAASSALAFGAGSAAHDGAGGRANSPCCAGATMTSNCRISGLPSRLGRQALVAFDSDATAAERGQADMGRFNAEWSTLTTAAADTLVDVIDMLPDQL